MTSSVIKTMVNEGISKLITAANCYLRNEKDKSTVIIDDNFANL